MFQKDDQNYHEIGTQSLGPYDMNCLWQLRSHICASFTNYLHVFMGLMTDTYNQRYRYED